jgi:peroxiredoxin
MSEARPDLPKIDFDAVGPAIGDRFPDVNLPNQRGEPVDLHAARAGRRALVIVYRSADW